MQCVCVCMRVCARAAAAAVCAVMRVHVCVRRGGGGGFCVDVQWVRAHEGGRGAGLIYTSTGRYMWMFPYGYTKELPAEHERMGANAEATALAIKGVHGKTFETGTIANVIYEASGSSCNWFYAAHGVVCVRIRTRGSRHELSAGDEGDRPVVRGAVRRHVGAGIVVTKLR